MITLILTTVSYLVGICLAIVAIYLVIVGVCFVCLGSGFNVEIVAKTLEKLFVSLAMGICLVLVSPIMLYNKITTGSWEGQNDSKKI